LNAALAATRRVEVRELEEERDDVQRVDVVVAVEVAVGQARVARRSGLEMRMASGR
jgi:hypothetical protein